MKSTTRAVTKKAIDINIQIRRSTALLLKKLAGKLQAMRGEDMSYDETIMFLYKEFEQHK